MDDVTIKMLKRHPRPLIDDKGGETARKDEGQVDRANVAGAIQRGLRLLRQKFCGLNPNSGPQKYVEVNGFTPWSRYGETLSAGVDTYKTVFVHIEVNARGRPVLLVLASMTRTTVAIKLPSDDKMNHWQAFERMFGRLATLLANPNTTKLTTSYDHVRQFLELRRPAVPDRIVDATALGSLVCPEEFEQVKMDPDCDNRMAGLCLIWSTLGEHAGPVYYGDWEATNGRKVPFPTDRKPDHLLTWPRAHRRESLSSSQMVYTEQLACASSYVWLRTLLWNGTHSELRNPIANMGATIAGCSEKLGLERSWLDTDPGDPFASGKNPKPHGHKEPESFDIQEERTSPSVIDDPYDPERPSTSAAGASASPWPVEPGYDGYEPQMSVPRAKDGHDEVVERRVVIIDPGASSDDDDDGSQAKASPAEQKRPAQRHWKGQREPPRKSRRQDQWKSVLRPLHSRYALSRKKMMNRKRAEYRTRNPDGFRQGFLGGNVCERCAEEPTHREGEECPVAYYEKHGRMPRACTLPCRYCDSFQHVTDACEFIHMRCAACGFRGHMAFECSDRTTEEWLVLYLDCAHMGKLTRANEDGPIRGRFGFGDTTGLALKDSTKNLISLTRNSIRFSRHRELAGNSFAETAKDLSIAREAILLEHAELDRRAKDFEREKEIFYAERAKFHAELREKQKAKGNADPQTDADAIQDDDGQGSGEPMDDSSAPVEQRGAEPEGEETVEIELHTEEYFV